MRKQPPLSLIKLSDAQAGRNDVSFVVLHLPQSIQELLDLLSKEITGSTGSIFKSKTWRGDKADNIEKVKVLLKRLRDYHDPMGLSLDDVAVDEQ